MTLDNLKYALILNNKMLLDRLKSFMHTHDNLETLNGLSTNEAQKLLFKGNLVSEQDEITDAEIQQMVEQAIAELDKENSNPSDTPSGDQDSNTHHFSTEWTSDETNHWHVCTDENCTEISDSAPHVWDEGVITKQPTGEMFGGEGEKTYTCTVCGKTRVETFSS